MKYKLDLPLERLFRFGVASIESSNRGSSAHAGSHQTLPVSHPPERTRAFFTSPPLVATTMIPTLPVAVP